MIARTESDRPPSAASGDLVVAVSSHRVLAAGIATLGLGLVANSVSGPLLGDAIDYPVSESMRNQTIGLDAAALLLFAPACLVIALLAWRGHRLAPVLAVSLGSYVAYIFLQYLVGPEFDYYPATLLLHLGLFVGGWLLAVHGWDLARRHFAAWPALSSRHAVAAAAMAAFVILRYLPGLAASITQEPLPDEVSGDITMYWLIVVSDLGIFIPIVLIIAVGIWRRTTWARLAMVATVGWFTIVSVAVATMSLTMVINDDRYASQAQLGLFIITTAVAGIYAIHLHRTLISPETVHTATSAPTETQR